MFTKYDENHCRLRMGALCLLLVPARRDNEKSLARLFVCSVGKEVDYGS